MRIRATVAIGSLLLASCGGGGGSSSGSPPTTPPVTPPATPTALVPGAGTGGADYRGGRPGRVPGSRRGAGEGQAGGDRRRRPGRQRARGVHHDRRQPQRDAEARHVRQHRPAGRDRAGDACRHRQGDYGGVPQRRWPCLHDAHRQPDRAGAVSARRRRRGPGIRAAVRGAVQFAAVFRPQHPGRPGHDRAEALAARPRRRSGRRAAVQERRRGRRGRG